MGIALFWDQIMKMNNDQLRTDTLFKAALDIVYIYLNLVNCFPRIKK